MRKQAKKGFTIVELVIVIALIAILAAVLIPTFSNVINNAHESNDTVMVKNLNTILNAEELNGNRAQTMQEAIDQAKEGGYNVDKLTPTSSGDIVWDQESNRFVLINAKGQVVFKDESVTGEIDLTNGAYKLWKITKNVAGEKIAYSLYLDKNYTGSDLADLQVKAGLDVGEHTDVAKITYTGETAAKNVTFVTSGMTALEISGYVDSADANKGDVISHYGEAGNVTVNKVANASYHIYGEVKGEVVVKQGHVAVETGATVNAVVVPATATGKVNLTNKGTLSVVNTENAPAAASVEVKNEGSIDVSVGATEITGNQSDKQFTASKKLTADTHEITEGGYYDGTGVTISSTGTSNDAQYAINIKTTEKVVISGVALTGLRGVQLKYVDSGAFDFTLIDSTITVSARGVQLWFNAGQENKNAKVNIINCKFEQSDISNYDTMVNNDKSTGIILNGIENAEVNIKGSTIQGFAYSVQFNNSRYENKNSTLNIEDSVLKGRAGVYLMKTFNSTVNIKNSNIKGVNTFKNATGSDNESFGLFVFEGSDSSTVNIQDCELEAYRGPAEQYNQEYVVDFKGTNNILNIKGNNTMREDVYFTSGSAYIPASVEDINAMYRYQNVGNVVNGSFSKAIFAVHVGDSVTEYDWLTK